MKTLAEIYSSQHSNRQQSVAKPAEQPRTSQINVVLHMPEVSGLLRHLDLLYSKMMINNMQQPDVQRIQWFNPGQGAVKQSQSVN
jgi:hypothetical protein